MPDLFLTIPEDPPTRLDKALAEAAPDAAALSRSRLARLISAGAVHGPAGVVQDGKASRRQVGLGIRAPGVAEIRSGLDAGDTVVVGGQERLQDGMAVTIKPLPATAAPSPAPAGWR